AQSLQSKAFADLVGRWVAFAYGGIVPPNGAFEEALAWVTALCRPAEDGTAKDGTAGAVQGNVVSSGEALDE
ncbi:MAG: hypothetical protein LBT39_01190, partial [Treponema sp.]|nr:hypothetical protein [Treponema sp.]